MNDSSPIDLTLLDSEDDEDEDEEGYDDIALSAAPCPKCRQTFTFDGGIYEQHIASCSRKREGSSGTSSKSWLCWSYVGRCVDAVLSVQIVNTSTSY